MDKMKSVLITGGSRGIGLGIAKVLAESDYNLAINGVRDQEEVAEVIHDLNATGKGDVIYCQGDVSNKNDRDFILQEIYDRFGTLNFLVNNAGIAPLERKDLLDMSPESYDRVMDTNLKGPFFLSQEVARKMIQNKVKNDEADFGIINNQPQL